MYIQLLMLGLILFGVLFFKGREKELVKELDSKEHPLRSLYPLAAAIYHLFVICGRQELFGTRNSLRNLYLDESPDSSLKKQGCKCIASILAIIAVGCFISLAYTYSYEATLVDGAYLKRPSAGGGSALYELQYESSLTEKSETASVRVSEIRLQGEDLEELKKRARDYLDKKILENNGTKASVSEPLNLVREIPGMGITVKWDEGNNWFVSSDGSLKNMELSEPVEVTLHADLMYFDETWEYSLELCILPYMATDYELFSEGLSESLKKNDNSGQSEEYYRLPEKVEDWEVSWAEEPDNNSTVLMVLGLVAAFMVIPAMKQEVKKKEKLRYEQMMKDYSDIISKFTMLLTAGMTCRGAWQKICSDYIQMKERFSEEVNNKKKKTGLRNKEKNKKIHSVKKKRLMHYAYEEMLISYREIQLGMPEGRVYEDFGTRCNLLAYQRFGTMLSRNLKRGSANIIDMLMLEARDCFAERRENVRRRGEETGTKLLIPMFGMLILVIAIVVVPAFSAF